MNQTSVMPMTVTSMHRNGMPITSGRLGASVANIRGEV